MIVVIILSLIYRVKVVDFVEGFINGVKKAVVPAGVVILIYVGLVIVTFHNYQLSMYVSIFDLFGGKFDIVGTSIVTILSGFFNSDPTYSFNAVVPYFMSIVTDTASYGKVFVLMTSMYGLAMLFVPTSIVLMVVLTYLRVPFGTWFKKIWLLLVALFIALILILLIWSPIFTWILVGLLVVLLIVLLALKKI